MPRTQRAKEIYENELFQTLNKLCKSTKQTPPKIPNTQSITKTKEVLRAPSITPIKI